MRILSFCFLLLVSISCSPTKYVEGLPYETVARQTFYIHEDKTYAMETWMFYDDKVVIAIDYYSPLRTTMYDSMEVKKREWVIGHITTKDEEVMIDGVRYLAFEAQWKTYTQGIGTCVLTPIYGWSNYLWFYIWRVTDEAVYVGNVPTNYKLFREPVVDLKYKNFIPQICEEV